ncbi:MULTISPECIES: DNA-3-methyladenine glycosylase I [Methylococcus]|uniref:DNA-3-methyladenine glycosylase I n=1 Tax=Methylococcus capsulatus TaxID=414 RepID=A0ABZ2F5G1_METCP|nr:MULTISPECIES: DNA-3-methyladenine glycosylase I [Methylococcus]MDF9390990.1 DNA-3-methyladenine glycosylase I [Methylococcus capsulatus]
MTSLHRCAWALRSPEETVYHDTEWGVPLHDDVKLFEYLVLDGAQAGLSWTTIIKKREAYRQAFDGFDPAAVAHYDEARIAVLLANPGIVRNRLKIESAVRNARVYLRIQDEFGSFDNYLWRFVDGMPVRNAWRDLCEIPASTPLSDTLSRDLKRRGCNFVGSTICYAFMQAAGLVNDHLVDCFRWSEVNGG